jgi:small subunit ribosomal protein S7e
MDKIHKKGEVSPLEQQVIASLTEIQNNSEEAVKAALRNLKISGVKEATGNGIRTLIVSVPYKQISAYHQVQDRIVPELEKKLAGSHVVLVAKRRAFPKTPEPNRRYKAIRPAGRTLRAVNEALLHDIVYPTAIVGKRVHYDMTGKQKTQVLLDPHDLARVEDRLPAFAAAYTKLTGIRADFVVAEQ